MNKAVREMMYGKAKLRPDKFGHSGASHKAKNKVFTKFVIVDIAGNPLRCFDDEDDAIAVRDYEFPGRRIEECSFPNFGNPGIK